MADQSGPIRFHAQFEPALEAYQKMTGVTLASHPLTEKLQDSHSIESITTILKDKCLLSSDLLEHNGITKVMESTISMLFTISVATTIQVHLSSYPPAIAILATLAILLAEAANSKGDKFNHKPFVDLIESIECFVKGVYMYTRIPSTPAVDENMFKILVKLLLTIALATKEFKQEGQIVFVKEGEEEIEAALQRLDQLTQEEAQSTAPETLKVGHSLVRGITMNSNDGSTDRIRETFEILHQLANDINKSKRKELQKIVRHWLSPPDPWKNHNIARQSRHSGTGAWFLHGGTLSAWTTSRPNSLLWVHGKPGSGKSVLCSTIIEEIKTMHKRGFASLAMYYHDFREGQKKDFRGLLTSLLFQLCGQSDHYFDILSTFHSTHLHGAQSPGDDELTQCLKNLLEFPGQAPVYLIIDALDECPNKSAMPSPREQVLELLVQLLKSRLTNLYICVTSRPETDIKIILQPWTFRSVSIHEERGQLEDIENYIRSVVNTDPRARRWKEEDKEVVIDALTERADGMFRWAYCQIVYLRDCHPGRIRHALADLPDTLDETYERTLREINQATSKFAHRLFQCVAAASRPLRVEELAEFLAFEFETGPIPKFHEDWRPEDPLEAVLSTCSTLLCLVNIDDFPVIQFSHFSVKEFLTSPHFAEKHDTISRRYYVSMSCAHTLVAQACLGLLLHLDETVTRDNLVRFPLAQYAAKHWVEHARFGGVSQDTTEGMKQLFDPRRPYLAIWVWIHDPWGYKLSQESKAKMPLPPRGAPLHYAAYCGFHTVVQFLAIERSQDVNSRRVYDHSTPLHLASREGHVEVARVLIQHGAKVSAKDQSGRTPLHLASEHGHVDRVRLLIEHSAKVSAEGQSGWILHLASEDGYADLARVLTTHGAKVLLAKGRSGRTPLPLAPKHGHGDLARLLIQHGAKVSAKDKQGHSPLHVALKYNHVDLARVLAEHGADVSAKDNHGMSLLHLALLRNHFAFAQVLIEHGADMSAKQMHGSTPLHLVLRQGHVDLAHGANLSGRDLDGVTPLHPVSRIRNLDLVQLLLERGADVSAENREGWTPLHEASFIGHMDSVRFLIEHGANVSAKDKEGWTSLHRASFHGHVDIVRFVIEHGADVSARDESGNTPLSWALSRSHVNVVQLLVEHGADASAKDQNEETPLHWASTRGHVDLARFLVEHGANVSAKNQSGETPLHRASSRGHLDLTRFLVEHGADMSAQDRNGETALNWTSSRGHVDLVQLLVGCGADSSAKDQNGETPLHWASSRGHVDLARFLVEHGANVSAKNQSGETPLHRASSRGHLDLTRFLIEYGADVSTKDQSEETPLHRASSCDHVDLARFLVEHGADVSAKDQSGKTPLHQASSRGHVDLVRFLVELGADVSAKDQSGETPLSWALCHDHMEIVRFLVEHGSDVSTKDRSGRTPLSWATSRGLVDLAQFLVEHGADVSAKDQSGETPLHRASSRGHVGLVRFFVEHGADVSASDDGGETPLHRASSRGRVYLVRFLVERGADVSAKDKRGLTPLHRALKDGQIYHEVRQFLIANGADTTAQASPPNQPPTHQCIIA